ILGVCLGHQAIAEAFGGSLKNLDSVFHGVATPIHVVKNDILFNTIKSKFNVGRYHSWAINTVDLPQELEITAVDDHNNIMAICHKTYNLRGVQFHPESILTENGFDIIKNWVLS
ncbi:MAG: aminodeoxychorismate/anthranilate synthase component II, partial [Bacteroidia bacterium]